MYRPIEVAQNINASDLGRQKEASGIFATQLVYYFTESKEHFGGDILSLKATYWFFAARNETENRRKEIMRIIGINRPSSTLTIMIICI